MIGNEEIDGGGRTASKANGNERGAAICMCTAGVSGKVRGGSEQDRTREKGTAPSAPARASAHKRHVFFSLDFCCVVPCYSLELIDVLFLCVYQVVRTVQYSVVGARRVRVDFSFFKARIIYSVTVCSMCILGVYYKK